MMRITVTGAPGLKLVAADMASSRTRWPTGETLRVAVATEAIRIAVYGAHAATRQPVPRRQLRHWLQAKLGGLLPELLDEESPLYYDALVGGGSGGNLEFVGDILEVPGQGLVPTPLRAVPMANDVVSLIGGVPTARLPGFDQVEVTSFLRIGRGLTLEEVRPHMPIQSPESYLGIDRAPNAANLLEDVLKRPSQPAPHGIETTWYAGNAGRYGFRFADRAMPAAAQGHLLAVAKVRLTPWESRYFLVDTKGGQRVWRAIHYGEWKVVCMALDHAARNPRRAIIQHAKDVVELRLQAPPTATVMKWLLLNAAQMDGRNRDYATWRLASDGIEIGRQLLPLAGFMVTEARA